MPFTLTARWLFPVARPPLAGGTVTIDDHRIVAVDPFGVRTPDLDLGNYALLPGLVNAHVHLDLSGARGLIPPTDPEHFTDWLRGVIAFRRSRTAEDVAADCRAGLAECLHNGTTTLGDITAGGASYDTVSTAAVRVVLYWELIGLTKERFDAAMETFAQVSGVSWEPIPDEVIVKRATPLCRWGKSLHAPYSVDAERASVFLRLSDKVAIHLAESPGELELLERRTGPFVKFLTEAGAYHEPGLARSVREFLTPWRSDNPPLVSLVHANYLPADFPFAANHSVVYCPRTHAAFGHPPHPFRHFQTRGVNVALGTDSLASNPDLDLLAEARFVRRLHPNLPGEVLLEMATRNGAKTMGFAEECGTLEVGKSADLVAVPLPMEEAGDPHALLFGEDCGPRRTWFRGEPR